MGESSPNILLIDPDRSMHRLLRRDLCGQGHSLMTATNAREALALLQAEPSLVLLELELSDMSGLELLGRLQERAEELPIIAFSENADTRTRVQVLDLGASDFLAKPFEVEELGARIRVALRRRFGYRVERPVYRLDRLEVDLHSRTVKLAGAEVRLSPKEYNLLSLFVLHAGKVLTHRFLLGELWDEKVDTQLLRVHVRQLRNKIEEDPANPKCLLTHVGIGYRLSPPEVTLNAD